MSDNAAAEVLKKPGRVAIHPAALVSSLCAAVFVVYLSTAWFGFVYDDVYQVLNADAIYSRQHFLRFFTEPSFYTPYYRPLFVAWYRLNDALFGTHPAGWHLSSVAVHVAVTALVYALVRRIAGGTAPALAAAATFGLHPIQVESVAWISAAGDPLCAMFFIAAFLAYLKSTQQGARWTMAALALYAGALLSKEPAVMFPLVVAAHVTISSEKAWQGRIAAAVRTVAPYLGLTAVYLVVHQRITHSVLTRQADASIGTALLTVPSLVWFYCQKLVLPVGLSQFYDPAYVSAPTAGNFLLPLAGVALIAGAIWVWQRRSRYSRAIAFGAWWFALTLAPVLNIRNFRLEDAVHDRYLYLPSVGFAMLIAIALLELSELGFARHKWAMPAMSAGLATLLAAMTVAQQTYWANDYLLYRRGVEIAPHNDKARNNLGRVLAERGEFSAAEAMFREVLRENPNSGMAHYNLGYACYRQQRFGEAEAHLTRAVALLPDDAFARLYLGLTEMQERKLDAAEREIRQAIRMRPSAVGYHLALGYVLEMKGDLQGALAETRAEVGFSPDNAAIRQRAAALQAKVAAGKGRN